MEKEWRPVPFLDGYYEMSIDMELRSLKRKGVKSDVVINSDILKIKAGHWSYSPRIDILYNIIFISTVG